MREEVSDWLWPELRRLAEKHKYNLATLNNKIILIDGLASIQQVREMLNELLEGHHYELVGVLAEFMVRDRRVSFQRVGKTYQRKVAKAPTASEAMLRMLDRAKAGASPYRAKVNVLNPWTKEEQTLILKVFAKSEEEAITAARDAGQSQSPLFQISDVKAYRLASDADEAETMKADLESITLSRSDDPAESIVPSFAEADNLMAAWRAQPPHVGSTEVSVKLQYHWENGESLSTSMDLWPIFFPPLDVSTLLKRMIALVLDGVPMYGRIAQLDEEMRTRWLAKGGEEHMSRLRAQCMLRDRHVEN